MSVAFTVIFILLGAYVILLGWLAWGFMCRRAAKRPLPVVTAPVSIIICARNEEACIVPCLRSLMEQDYPPDLVELILVDDASSDATMEKARAQLQKARISYRVISNRTRMGKKASIASALQLATHPLIVLRDADTYTGSRLWLGGMVESRMRSHADLVIGPVAVAPYGGWLAALQETEASVLLLLTGGSANNNAPFLCSAANLMFTKEIFGEVGGFASHAHLASGDDIFFLEDVRRRPGSRIVFASSRHALVYTYPEPGAAALLRQRIRWASKFRHNANILNGVLAVLTFLLNLAFPACLAVAAVSREWRPAALLFVLCKPAFELLLLFLATTFTGNRRLLLYALPLAVIYPLYAVATGAGALIFKPRWKE